jgi:hypothetical protein
MIARRILRARKPIAKIKTATAERGAQNDSRISNFLGGLESEGDFLLSLAKSRGQQVDEHERRVPRAD